MASALTRRRFLAYGGAAGLSLAVGGRLGGVARAQPPQLLDPLLQPRFVNGLPNPISRAFAFTPNPDLAGTWDYEIAATSVQQSVVHLDPLTYSELLTDVWGYGQRGQTPTYPGRTLFALRDEPIRVRWTNELGYRHLLDVDETVHWAFSHLHGESIASLGVPVVTHVHGGHTEAASDGGPEQWFTPGFAVKGGDWQQEVFRYANDQEAGTVWYHDHALGITRLNVYAGLAGFYILRDANEVSLGLPGSPYDALGAPTTPYEVGLAIQDRLFTSTGALFYPSAPDVRGAPEPSVLPEFFGDVVLVNGKAWPFLDVEPRRYRLRIINGSDSRFYTMKMQQRSGRALTITQIGTDGGFLHRPVPLTGALVLGPGERADVVVDFSEASGNTVVLTNNATTPYPFGAPAGPSTRQLMAFRVGATAAENPPLPEVLRPAPFAVEGTPTRTRRVLLYEGEDRFGRIFPQLGTVEGGAMEWDDPTTETPHDGDVEVWEIYNTTPDAHPIHLHLPQFEVLDRAPFRAQQAKNGALSNIRAGAAVPAPPAERGPKDTVQTFPGQVTRIKARFDLPAGTTGDQGYVWHCHILSHEDHEMMRRLEVQST
jgi:spore coat protein A